MPKPVFQGGDARYPRPMAVADRLAADYEQLTRGCGLLDRSERGKLALTGAGAKEFLNGQVTNDVEALGPGHGCYAAFLTHKGKMLGDLRVLDLGDELLLDTERLALQELFNMIRKSKIGFDAELHKRTVERGLLTVIPQEAGLNERAVSFTKGCYVGQETVARLHYRGKPNRHLRGLRLSAPGASGDELRLGEKVVGKLGTVALSPVHGPIALAIVR